MRSLICAVCLMVLPAAPTTAQDSAQNPEQAAWTVLNAGLNDNSTDVRIRAVHVLGELNNNAKAKDAAISAC